MPEAEDQKKIVTPLTAEGLNFDKPSTQRLWNKLDNVVFHNNTIQTRPGLVPVGAVRQDITNVPAGVPAAIFEASGLGYSLQTSGGVLSELLRPDATISNSNWAITGAATAHQALDESPPDNGTTKITTSTDAAAIVLEFPDATDRDVVHGVTVWVRGKGLVPNDKPVLNIQLEGDDNSYNLVMTHADFTEDESTITSYQDFFVFIPSYTASGVETPFTNTELADLKVTLTADLTGTLTTTTGFSRVDGFGDENDFDQSDVNWAYGAGAGRTWDDSEVPIAFVNDPTNFTTGSSGDKVSLSFEAPAKAYNTVTSLEAMFSLQKATNDKVAFVKIYHEGTDGTWRQIGSQHTVKGTSLTTSEVKPWALNAGARTVTTGAITTNPETSAAWTQTELAAGVKFGIEIVSSTSDVELVNAQVVHVGTFSDGGLDINCVGLYVSGDSMGGSIAQDKALGRILATNQHFQRYYNDNDGLLEDVHGAAGLPTAAPMSWDHTEFFNAVYVENGVDETYQFPNSIAAAAVTAQLTTNNIGQTIWTFGNRLMKGDIIAAGVRHTKRVKWCGLADETDWTGSTAGDLDLTHGGSGRIRKGLALSGHLAAIYLDRGIYTLRWTGDDLLPFDPTMQDPDTGLIAPQTVKSAFDANGISTHFFLGRGPNGASVFAFDGTQAVDIGSEVRDEIRRLARHETIEHSFAGIDPQRNLYLLFIPEGTQLFPKQCWAYHIDTGHWTRYTFNIAITCLGQWTILNDDDSPQGDKYLILGSENGLPYYFDPDSDFDVLVPGDVSPNANIGDFLAPKGSPDEGGYWQYEVPIEVQLESGDFELSQERSIRLSKLKKVWLTLVDRGDFQVTVDESIDTGKNYINSTTINFDGQDDGEIHNRQVFMSTPTSGRSHRVRLKWSSATAGIRNKVELIDYSLFYQEAGTMP